MRIGPRVGVADSGHFDGFRLPLSSALFYIRLVIRHFSKTAQDRCRRFGTTALDVRKQSGYFGVGPAWSGIVSHSEMLMMSFG